MAVRKPQFLLGLEDEPVLPKYEACISYLTSKIGGKPNWPVADIVPPSCGSCQRRLTFIAQIYAPLESSQYHRTLYIFCCIHPECWNRQDSWVCLRSQVMDDTQIPTTMGATGFETTAWLDLANDWGEMENEENGNFVFDNCDKWSSQISASTSSSSSTPDDLATEQGFLNVSQHSNEVPNQNLGAYGLSKEIELMSLCDRNDNRGAEGPHVALVATAEIEGDEGDVIALDTPEEPQTNIQQLLEERMDLPPNVEFEFISKFISVIEEPTCDVSFTPHERELLLDYQQQEGLPFPGAHGDLGEKNIGLVSSPEGYEKVLPAHGDKYFHKLITRTQLFPQQILRYTRDEGATPLFLSPIRKIPRQCQNCNGSLIFEVQLLPTFVSSLKIPGFDGTPIEFGTVVIYTCFNSCWTDGDKTRREEVVVQQESY